LLLVMASGGILLICSCLGVAFIVRRLCGIWDSATCRWTDCLGSLTCLTVGIYACYNVVTHPLI
jgi:hypothetical protein